MIKINGSHRYRGHIVYCFVIINNHQYLFVIFIPFSIHTHKIIIIIKWFQEHEKCYGSQRKKSYVFFCCLWIFSVFSFLKMCEKNVCSKFTLKLPYDRIDFKYCHHLATTTTTTTIIINKIKLISHIYLHYFGSIRYDFFSGLYRNDFSVCACVCVYDRYVIRRRKKKEKS